MKKVCLVVLLGLCFTLIPVASSHAGEMDVLLNKLVEKGILTSSEASSIKSETEQEMASQARAGQGFSVPEWVQKMKIKGDFRLRYQYERRKSYTDAHERARIRFRLGIDTKVNDQVKIGAGLATGGTDPRSTNQTLDNGFETPDIRLDYAYAEYSPTKNLSIIGGKFPRNKYLWNPTDLLWDDDIRPDGGSLHFEDTVMEDVTGFVNGGVWTIKDQGTSDRPNTFLAYVQGGLGWKNDKFDAKVATTYYGFNGLKGTALSHSTGTNTLVGSVLMYDYDSVGVSGEFGVNDLFGGLPLGIDEHVAIVGDFIDNMDPKKQHTGWSLGAKFGNKKIGKERGQWNMEYLYATLATDAFPDAFPDADRYGGGTDMLSHEAIINYTLAKNVILGLDYYNSNRIKAASNTEKIIQADLLFKF